MAIATSPLSPVIYDDGSDDGVSDFGDEYPRPAPEEFMSDSGCTMALETPQPSMDDPTIQASGQWASLSRWSPTLGPEPFTPEVQPSVHEATGDGKSHCHVHTVYPALWHPS